MKQISLGLVLLLLASTLGAQAELIRAKAVLEPVDPKEGKAVPGGEVKLRLQFEVDKGFHAYHKDNPGYSKPISVKFSELSGLTEVGEAQWPKYHEGHPDPKDLSWVEYELSGTFEIVYNFKVPLASKGALKVSGSYEAQVCDEKGCTDRSGEFSASLDVFDAPRATPGGGDSEALKRLEDKVEALAQELGSHKKDLEAIRKANEELNKALKDFIKSQQEKAGPSGEKDDHGFYVSYDFAIAEARKQGKLLLIDFNGEY
ncbi:MAG: hypothetical protein HPKKFMNG_00892 [Planctomycetes bacterium]|nr:hypothetical protein [Planctomycetota bacterium]HRJ78788.1 protein-disulfide reductase DsbD family protein [Planctomycetota bacterium]